MGDKVGKLNSVITELEEQMEDIKNFSQVLKKIEQISKNIAQVDNKMTQNAQSYITTTETMKKSAGLLESKLNDLESMIAKKIQELYKDNQTYQKEMDDSLRIRLENFSLNIENKIEVITRHTQSIDNNILEMNKKLELVLDQYEQDKHRGFWARLLNTTT